MRGGVKERKERGEREKEIETRTETRRTNFSAALTGVNRTGIKRTRRQPR